MDTGKSQSPTPSPANPAVASTDVLFECPACAKSLVIDGSAAGMTIECPQCHIPLIVPPQSESPMAPPPPMPPPLPRTAPAPMPPPTAPAKTESVDVAELQERLNTLASQLREQESQWTEVTSRITSRINQINHDLVLLARLETSQKKMLGEWSQIVAKIAAVKPPALPPTPLSTGGGHTKASFHS